MNSISDFMVNNHRECDNLFAVAEESAGGGKWQKAQPEFDAYRSEMERHLRMEEEVMFPAFEAKTGMVGGPTLVMRNEHLQMRKLIDDMAQKIAAKDGDGYLGVSETLMILMQQHNMKEEQMLYGMMDQAFGAEAGPLLERAGASV
ncbi:MAG TPA: hemerythrin HHE cation-binding protein [Oxalobacteraceae bacterium]|jgi:iron-sulfur cluster repair protein YtfE (RIC family)|nr:hemerythrin HHE cation-binding protein [Oxalobacteraceae bacterium]